VITHVNNNMEPLRGLHIFARALPRLLAEVPAAQVLVIGKAEARAYGGDAPGGGTWKDACFAGVDYDPARVHFLGRIEHARMLAAMRLGSAHVYYTYPFVLSWSLAEAMASGCYVIASDTGPLRDAIEDGVNGRLLPFFDVDALSAAMIAACRDPRGLGAAADRGAGDGGGQVQPREGARGLAGAAARAGRGGSEGLGPNRHSVSKPQPPLLTRRGRGTMRSMVEGACRIGLRRRRAPSTTLRAVPLPLRVRRGGWTSRSGSP
jgi:glycosyltransferase involved in cell wall biosynthesis